MTIIRQEDVIQSVADALQYISYFHPLDFIQALHRAYEREESKAAKDAMAQIVFCGAVTHRKGFRKNGRGSRKGRLHSSAEEISLT